MPFPINNSRNNSANIPGGIIGSCARPMVTDKPAWATATGYYPFFNLNAPVYSCG